MGPEVIKVTFPEMQDFEIIGMRIRIADVNAKAVQATVAFLRKINYFID